MREKLIELLSAAGLAAEEMCINQTDCDKCPNAKNGCQLVTIADHLIANGVTIQSEPLTNGQQSVGIQFSPTAERLQKEADLYWKAVRPGLWHLTCSACDSHLGCRETAKYCPECGVKFARYIDMPEPPKNEGISPE